MLLKYFKSEQAKLLYSKQNILVMAGIVISVPLMAASLGAFAGETGALLAKSKLIQAFYLGQAGYVVLTALFFGSEYRRSALRTSLLGIPRRGAFLLSKLLCILVWTALLLCVSAAGAFIAVNMSLPGSIGISAAAEALIPACISTAELVVITGGLVILSRSVIVPMAVIVSLILGLGSILMQYSPAMRYLPVVSAMNGFLVTSVPIYPAAGEGITVQALWGAVLALAAYIVFGRRYVR